MWDIGILIAVPNAHSFFLIKQKVNLLIKINEFIFVLYRASHTWTVLYNGITSVFRKHVNLLAGTYSL